MDVATHLENVGIRLESRPNQGHKGHDPNFVLDAYRHRRFDSLNVGLFHQDFTGFGAQRFDLRLLDDLASSELFNLSIQITHIAVAIEENLKISKILRFSAFHCYEFCPYKTFPVLMERTEDDHKIDANNSLRTD